MPKRSSNLSSLGRKPSDEKTQARNAKPKRCQLSLVPAMFALIGGVVALEAHADVFDSCAHERNVDEKITACMQATKSTSYPWILQWVYRELARSYRERGEIQQAITNYERSLALEEREETRREMEELTLLAQQGGRSYARRPSERR